VPKWFANAMEMGPKKKNFKGVSGGLCTQSAKGNSCICEWGAARGVEQEKAESVEMCYKLNFIETCLKFFVRHFHRFWPPLGKMCEEG